MTTKTKKVKIEIEPKMKAFIKFWVDNGNAKSELDGVELEDDTISLGSKEFKILTDNEADAMAKKYILDSLWTFNKSFLDGYSDAISEMDDRTWAAITDRCESSNGAVLAMVRPNIDSLIEDAISSDGRGYFLNTYDNNEDEVNIDGQYFYIYRIN